MNSRVTTVSPASPAMRWCRDNVHFLVVASVMAAAALLLYGGIMILGWRFYKEPVPWTKSVEVDENFRLLSLPSAFSDPQGRKRFTLITTDVNEDGQPDGDIIIPDDEMELLKIGTEMDKKRRSKRCSSWYFVRRYEDVDKKPPHFRWRLECYYYTGMLDQVPHVPERCAVAGGARLLGTEDVTFDIPEGPKLWKGKVVFRRALYSYFDRERQVLSKHVQYYTFSMNGRPESSWKVVRLNLTYPWVRYCYFAKIQFAPEGEVLDLDDTDKAAEEFTRCFLPGVLEVLPMPEDIEKLRRTGKN